MRDRCSNSASKIPENWGSLHTFLNFILYNLGHNFCEVQPQFNAVNEMVEGGLVTLG